MALSSLLHLGHGKMKNSDNNTMSKKTNTNKSLIDESMTAEEISRIPTSQLKTYTAEEIIEAFIDKVHEFYSSKNETTN